MDRRAVNRFCAAVPPAFSFSALIVVLVAVATGAARGPTDEGFCAHVFQLLIAAQAPLVAGFLVTAERHDGAIGSVAMFRL